MCVCDWALESLAESFHCLQRIQKKMATQKMKRWTRAMMVRAVLRIPEWTFRACSFVADEEYLDYDSDFEDRIDKSRGVPDVDPYAGM